MTQARGVTEALPMKAQHSTQVIYLQQDLNSKDCGESIVKITKYLQEAMHKSKSSSHSRILASSDSEGQTLFLKPTERANRLFTYDVAGREVAYGVLSGQGHGAEHDEDQDEVCEDLVVDQLVAEHTEPGGECEKVQVKSQ